MTDGQPTRRHYEDADAVAGAQFRYRSATDRRRVVDRIAWALAEAEFTRTHQPAEEAS